MGLVKQESCFPNSNLKRVEQTAQFSGGGDAFKIPLEASFVSALLAGTSVLKGFQRGER